MKGDAKMTDTTDAPLDPLDWIDRYYSDKGQQKPSIKEVNAFIEGFNLGLMLSPDELESDAMLGVMKHDRINACK
jgi:hypothetical protein